LPAALYADGQIVLAWGFAAVFVGGWVFSLIDGHRAPAIVARRRARGEPEPVKIVVREEPLWTAISNSVVFTVLASIQFTGHTGFFHARWFMVALALFYWGTLAARILHPRAAQPA
jgi:hypothetical protein